MSLENRIEALERELTSLKRRNRAIGVFALFAISVPALLAFTNAQEKVIRAESFEVVREGKTVGKFSAGGNGGALAIFRKDSNPVAGLSTDPDGGGILTIYNKDAKVVAGLAASPGGGALVISNNDLKRVALLAADASGGFLSISNNDEKGVALLSADASGGIIGIFNKDEKPVALLHAVPAGGEFGLFTPGGQVRFKAP